MTGWNNYPGTPPRVDGAQETSILDAGKLPPSNYRQIARRFLNEVSVEHLFVFARGAHLAMETGVTWPRGVQLQALAWQLQQGRIDRGTRSLIRIAATPLRSLIALSHLPAWTGMVPGAGIRTLCVARTRTLARAYRQLALRALSTPLFRWALEERTQASLLINPDQKLPPIPGPAALMRETVWAAIGDAALEGPFDQIVLVDPLAPDADAAEVKHLLARLKPLSGTKKKPASIAVVAALLPTTPAIALLGNEGFQDIDIPKRAYAPTTLRLTPEVTCTFRHGESLVIDHPSPHDLHRIRRDVGQVAFETLWT